MAGIDKTYTDSYKDYKEFKDWADTQFVTFYDGFKVCIGDFVWKYNEEDFNGRDIPIMNTPSWVDIYLIQNCKSQFVLDRMKSVYSEESFEEFKNIDLTSKPPKEFQQNRKIVIKKCDETKFPLHNKPYLGNKKWLLTCENSDFYFNSITNVWSHYDSHYPRDSYTHRAASVKSIIRHLRKQYLPKGVEFKIRGSYVGEIYSVVAR
jgi:hypothetical protein